MGAILLSWNGFENGDSVMDLLCVLHKEQSGERGRKNKLLLLWKPQLNGALAHEKQLTNK